MRNLMINLGLAAFVLMTLIACEKEDQAANKLHSGSGIWNLKEYNYAEYDTLGNIVSETILNDVGTFVFFQSTSLSALFGYYQGVFIVNDSLSKIGYTLEYMIDGRRAHIMSYSGPVGVGGLYSVEKFGGHKQIWSAVTLNDNLRYENTIASKLTLTMVEQLGMK